MCHNWINIQCKSTTRLLDGRLSPGETIRPDVIGDELGVSAVPVREALRTLEGEGQVTSRPHRGYIVAQLDIKDLTEIYSIREILETKAISQAVPKLQAEDLEQMREAIDQMESVNSDIFQLRTANRKLHFALLEAAKMPYLNRMISGLRDVSEPCHYRSLNFMSPENLKRIDEEYRNILAAAEAGDTKLVIKELDNLYSIRTDLIIEALLVDKEMADQVWVSGRSGCGSQSRSSGCDGIGPLFFMRVIHRYCTRTARA
jgi:DNA-binding GntR family transcriptional regulator